MTFKEIKKYINSLLNNKDTYMFNNTTINAYSICYYIFIFVGISQLLTFKIYNIILFISFMMCAKSVKKRGFKNIPYIFLLTSLIIAYVYYALNNLIIIPITLVIASYPSYLLLRYIKIKKITHLYLFEENGFRGCNLVIRELCPIENYNNVIKINIRLLKDLSGKEMKVFNDNIVLFCDKHKYLYMGFKYEKFKLNYEFYIYADKYEIKTIEKYLKNNINYEYTITEFKDINYNYYFDEIIPSDKLFLHMCNRNIINSKLPKEINLMEEQNLILILTFKTHENAIECKNEIEKLEDYKRIRYEDNTKYALENNIKGNYNYILYVEKKTRIGLSKINMITDSMYDYAKKFDGSFEEWGIGTIED